MGSPRAGSNPAHSVVECLLNLTSKIICVGLLYLISSEVGFKHQGLILSDYCERRGRGITSAQLKYWIVKDISSMRTFFGWITRGKFGRLMLHNCQGDLGSRVSTIMTKHHLKRHSCDGRVVKALDSKSNGVSPRRFESCRLRSFYLYSKI